MGGAALAGRRVTREEGLEIAKEVLQMLAPHVVRSEVCGSIRRGKPDAGDVDLVIIGDSGLPDRQREVCGSLKNGNPAKKLLHRGVQVDITVTTPESWGAALCHCTGSKEWNIVQRSKAIALGYKLNQYGLFDGDKQIAGATEEGMYKALEMKWTEPKDREA